VPFNPAAACFDDDPSPLVVFATKRGRAEGCGEALDGATERVAKIGSAYFMKDAHPRRTCVSHQASESSKIRAPWAQQISRTTRA
jgi:hypothetical protein